VAQIVRGPPLERTVVAAKAHVEAIAAGQFRLVLTLRTGDVEETKTITAGSCSSLAQATATIVALAIESPSGDAARRSPPALDTGPAAAPPAPPTESDAAGTSRPPSPPPPTSPAPLTPATPSSALPFRPDRPQSAWSLAPGAFASIDTSTLPAIAPELGLSLSLRLHRFRAGLLGTISLPQSSTFSQTAGASFDMMAGGAWGAYLVSLATNISLGPSASVEATFVRARAFGVRFPIESSTVWPSIAGGGRLEARLMPGLSLVTRGELLFHVDAPPFSLATVEAPLRLHQPSSPAARMSVGVEIVLP